jgi:hypothetical protein
VKTCAGSKTPQPAGAIDAVTQHSSLAPNCRDLACSGGNPELKRTIRFGGLAVRGASVSDSDGDHSTASTRITENSPGSSSLSAHDCVR